MGDFFGSLGKGILEFVLPSVATVIAGFVVLLLKRLASKYGLEVTEKQEERLKQIVVEKIHATEEAAHRDPTMTGSEKHTKTVQDVITAATDDPTIPNPTIDKVASTVDAALSQVRAGYLPNAGLPGMGRR